MVDDAECQQAGGDSRGAARIHSAGRETELTERVMLRRATGRLSLSLSLCMGGRGGRGELRGAIVIIT